MKLLRFPIRCLLRCNFSLKDGRRYLCGTRRSFRCNFMPGIAMISMDKYNDASRLVDGNYDYPRLTDYDTLLENVRCLKEGKPAEVPIYDFKTSKRDGYKTVEVPTSRVVITEGIHALSERLRPLLDLRVSVTGGVHFDLVKRVLRDMNRSGQVPQGIIYQISETEWVTDDHFIISPRITFEVQGEDRITIGEVAKKLGLDGTYIPRSSIEQIQLEKLTAEVGLAERECATEALKESAG